MNIYERIKTMNMDELAEFLCAVDADLWGYCKANITEENIQINRVFLSQEVKEYGG